MIFCNRKIERDKQQKGSWGALIHEGGYGRHISLSLPHWFKNLKKGLSKNLTLTKDYLFVRVFPGKEAKDNLFVIIDSRKGCCRRGDGDIFIHKKNKKNVEIVKKARVKDKEGTYQTAILELTGPCLIRVRYSGGMPHSIINFTGVKIDEMTPEEALDGLAYSDEEGFKYLGSPTIQNESSRFDVSEWKKI